jgi:hypothetical protein
VRVGQQRASDGQHLLLAAGQVGPKIAGALFESWSMMCAIVMQS